MMLKRRRCYWGAVGHPDRTHVLGTSSPTVEQAQAQVRGARGGFLAVLCQLGTTKIWPVRVSADGGATWRRVNSWAECTGISS